MITLKITSKAFVSGLIGLIALSLPLAVATAKVGSASYTYVVGAEPLCDLGPTACPVVSSASNGDTITASGSGTMSIFPHTVNGGGTFTHKNAAGDVLGSGSWEARNLLTFRSYGDATPQGLPANLEGGLALIVVHLSPDAGGPGFLAIMRITCELGNFPPSAHEGIRLTVLGGPNFNHEMSGFTVFIRES